MLCFHANYGFCGLIKGVIKDANSAPLPFASVYVEGTTIGTNANSNGYYELSLPDGLYKLQCQYIGYKKGSFNISITGNEVATHDFVLAFQNVEMKEVVISSNTEDPAYRIIRNAIKKKSDYLREVKHFQSGIYLKGVLRTRKVPKRILGQKVKNEDIGADSTGKGVLYLVEENADYYRDGDKERTVVHSVKESGNPGGVGMSTFPDVITFYENNVSVFDGKSRGFISPISDNALLYYKFRLEGEFNDQGKTVYKIKVTQRRAYEPCFYGTIYISDSDWAIHSLDLTLAKKSGMDMFDTLRLKQIYLPLGDQKWVIKSQVMYFTINLFGIDATANFVTVYNKQKSGEPVPDTMFNKKLISSYDASANKKDSAYWDNNRPIPLEGDEQKDYIVKDSLRKVLQDPKRLDSLAKIRNRFRPLSLLTNGYSYYSKTRNVRINSVLLGTDNMLNYNTVEGFNLAPALSSRFTRDSSHYIAVDAIVRYGFSNTHLNGIARVSNAIVDKRWFTRVWRYGIEGGKYVFQFSPENPVLPLYNTYATLLYHESELRLYERTEIAGFLRRNYGNGLSWLVRASWQERYRLENTDFQDIINGNESGIPQNNPTHLLLEAQEWNHHNAIIISGNVAWQPGFRYVQYPDHKVPQKGDWPTFTISYQKGISGLFNSIVNYDKWRFSVNDDLDLKLAGNLFYNVAAGGFLNANTVSVPDLNHLFGNRGVGLASPYLQSYQFARYYAYSNKEPMYGEAHIEYHLNGLLTNKIPLFRRLNWYLVTGLNSYYAKDNLYYHEAFVGLDNIGYKLARFFRLDFVQSWDSQGGRNAGLRLGLNAESFTIKKSNIGSEW